MKRALVLWLSVSLAVLGAAGCEPAETEPDGGDALELAPDQASGGQDVNNPSGCPEQHPYFSKTFPPPGCEGEGTVCVYPAPGCAPGTLPDNVCTCVNGDLRCDQWLKNCLPVADSGQPLDDSMRPGPPHRPEATACPALPAATSEACVPSRTSDETNCANDLECEADQRCLQTHLFSSDWSCQCQSTECSVDADCGADRVCVCGAVSNADRDGGCGGWNGQSCMHRCVAASECRIDSDCGPEGYCSPVYSECGWSILRYACHHPDKPECLSDWECGQGYYHGICTQLPGDDGWTCHQKPLCD